MLRAAQHTTVVLAATVGELLLLTDGRAENPGRTAMAEVVRVDWVVTQYLPFKSVDDQLARPAVGVVRRVGRKR